MSSSLAQALPLVLALALPSLTWAAETLPMRERLADDFTALRERPLFSPDRSAPVPFAPAEPEPVVVVAEPEPPPPAAAPDWQLVGVVRSETLNSATFTAPGVAAAFTLSDGESRDGWTLKRVGQFDVTLDGAGGRAVLRFSDTGGGDVSTGMPLDAGMDQGGVPPTVPDDGQQPAVKEERGVPLEAGEEQPPASAEEQQPVQEPGASLQ